MIVKTAKLLTVTLLILFSSSRVAAQKCDVDSGFRGASFRVGYEQRQFVKVFKSLDEIPQPVRNRLDEYLLRKLGDAFMQKLKFEEGVWLDREKLRKQFPSVYEANANLGSYDLTFFFSEPDKGLKAFFTKMALNGDGSIKAEIRLPDIKQEPKKAEIVSCSDAHSIAESRGFPIQFSFARFEYSEMRKSFIWIISDTRAVEPDDPLMPRGKGTYRCIEIDANTGDVVRIYKETIII